MKPFYESTGHLIPEVGSLHVHRHENLAYHYLLAYVVMGYDVGILMDDEFNLQWNF
jgi:hypothetical protein